MAEISTLHALRMLGTRERHSPEEFPLGKIGNKTCSVAQGGSPRAKSNNILEKAIIRLGSFIGVVRAPYLLCYRGHIRMQGAAEKQNRLCASVLGQLSGDFTADAKSSQKMQRTLNKMLNFAGSHQVGPERRREQVKSAMERVVGYTTPADRTAILATLENMNWKGLTSRLGANADLLQLVKPIIESKNKLEAAGTSTPRAE